MIGYLDCSTGVSGDKFLGALLDVGAVRGDFTAEDLRAVVSALAPEARVEVERTISRGISATSVRVIAQGQPHSRTWADIRALIDAADLPLPVRERSLRAFELLAVAEATVHGTEVDRVHFHEVGAIDSIVDMVGVCLGLHALGIDHLVVSPIAVGSGTVETSHGILPVPAPATARILAGVPILAGPASGELTTPTGAALVCAAAAEFGALPSLRIDRVGYGAGTSDIGCPNVCRLIVAQSENAGVSTAQPDGLRIESVVLLETNIDHLSAEELSFIAEELMAAGALDVWQLPIVMKKGRVAVTLSALSTNTDAIRLAQSIIALTGSLGVRRLGMERYVAERDVASIDTPWGPVRVKTGAGRTRPEHEDVARIARETGRPYSKVARELTSLAETAPK